MFVIVVAVTAIALSVFWWFRFDSNNLFQHIPREAAATGASLLPFPKFRHSSGIPGD